MSETFQFEKDFAGTLRCIPMAVRLSLDLCGIKLNLKEWSALSGGERKALLEMPCQGNEQTEAYRRNLAGLILRKTGKPPQSLSVPDAFPWDGERIPPDVLAQSSAHQIRISPEQWRDLNRLQRFALCKLSRPGHENRNFLPAAREFGLA